MGWLSGRLNQFNLPAINLGTHRDRAAAVFAVGHQFKLTLLAIKDHKRVRSAEGTHDGG
ncbi:MAG: hypothetical protein VCA36_03760 [Opitutales bacterium]